MTTIETMIETIESVADRTTGSGASAAEIAQAEQRLGVKFPASYRVFLERYGWAKLGTDSLYGLGPDRPADLPIPAHLVPLMNDGFGNHYCLDSRVVVDGENPVVFWNHEGGPDQTPETEAASFAQWLTAWLEAGFEL